MLIVSGDVEEGFLQYAGRIFRTDDEFPIMIDLVDKFRSCYNNSRNRCKIAEEMGAEVKDFNLFFPQVLNN
jgi:hypothetical protein